MNDNASGGAKINFAKFANFAEDWMCFVKQLTAAVARMVMAGMCHWCNEQM